MHSQKTHTHLHLGLLSFAVEDTAQFALVLLVEPLEVGIIDCRAVHDGCMAVDAVDVDAS